jgi:hypothetical protein
METQDDTPLIHVQQGHPGIGVVAGGLTSRGLLSMFFLSPEGKAGVWIRMLVYSDLKTQSVA